MGKKSSKQSSTTTSTSRPPKWARPILKDAVGTVSSTVHANQPALDQMAGAIRGFLPGLGEKAFGSDAGLGAATSYATDVLGGKYLAGGNPYINDMASLARGNVANDINSMFSMGGRAFSDSHMQDLAKGMGEAELGVRYQNYGNERNAQTQAAGMMPALNQAQYSGVMPYLAASQTAAGLPFTGIQNLGQISSLLSGWGTQKGTQTGTAPGGWGGQLLGAAAMALPFIPGFGTSARAAKTKIEEIGLWDERGDELKKYRFAYKWAPDVMMEGVMAEEVAEKRPWALGPIDHRGYQTVNYAVLSEAA